MKHENKHTQKGNKKMTQEITSYEEYSIHTTLKSAKAMIDQLFSFSNINIYDYEIISETRVNGNKNENVFVLYLDSERNK